ncbi:MAG: hypothetical protein KME05_23235 [Gloeocapsa sp. UFS-A4-WI-NPMV-4B04]|jgi:hypothetical protein|nr:hypothetical protein [Gloeocapsa sp. UFS-A4-WI-NPMV-4B04]
MSKTTTHHVIGIGGSTLIVFYTEAHCWQFRLISNGGAGVSMNANFTYYTPEAVLRAGLE